MVQTSQVQCRVGYWAVVNTLQKSMDSGVGARRFSKLHHKLYNLLAMMNICQDSITPPAIFFMILLLHDCVLTLTLPTMYLDLKSFVETFKTAVCNNDGFGLLWGLQFCNNCTGQNKNNCMLWYLAWRAMMGRHTQITLSFLVAGTYKVQPWLVLWSL